MKPSELMMNNQFTVHAMWDEEARVWAATSEGVPGLGTEADTMEQLVKKLKTLIPELLDANSLKRYI
jgi:hypothetical protein